MFDLTPHINVAYPKNNEIIFEEWFREVYRGCYTDRELLPINFTSFWVNNGYGNNLEAKKYLQDFVDGLDRSKKYFCVVQYDDGVLIDFKDLDVLQLNMSKKVDVEIPLLCQPHPYKFMTEKKWLANFVGGRTHPIRSNAERLKDLFGYYISYEQHNIESYCKILHESIFTLCFRGYGRSSFRICESLQYGSIPVYISDEFINQWDLDFNDFGVVIEEKDAGRIDEILSEISPQEILRKQNLLEGVYKNYYTFESNLINVKEFLQLEYNSRKNASQT